MAAAVRAVAASVDQCRPRVRASAARSSWLAASDSDRRMPAAGMRLQLGEEGRIAQRRRAEPGAGHAAPFDEGGDGAAERCLCTCHGRERRWNVRPCQYVSLLITLSLTSDVRGAAMERDPVREKIRDLIWKRGLNMRISTVHPRACGEQLPEPNALSQSCGSSPRMRGTGHSPDQARARRRFIPAHAGNSETA